jgi:NitT/TauT family transport system substrate-binding protein
MTETLVRGLRRTFAPNVLVLLMAIACASPSSPAPPTAAPVPTQPVAAPVPTQPGAAPVPTQPVAAAVPTQPIAAPPTPVPTQAPATLTHLIVAYSNVSPTILPLWIAQQTGLFEKHGLDVDLQYVASATSVAALVSGQMQLATVGLSETLGAIAGGADLVVIANQVPAYTYIFEVAPGIETAADLKGKSIGISRTGSSSDIGTRVVLKKFGLDPDRDVQLVQTGSVSDRAAAMKGGALQGAVAAPPDTLAVERLGWHPLFDLAGQQLPAVTLGLVVQRAYRDANQATVQAYVDALLEGIARVRSDRASALELLKSNLNLDADEDLNATYDYYTRQELMPSLPYARVEQFADTLAILGRTDERLPKLDLAARLDSSFIKSAEERGVAK